MLNRLTAILLIFLVSVARKMAEGQEGDCQPLQGTDLGDTESFNRTGLIAMSLANVTAQPEVQLLNHTIVCIAQGTKRDTWRMVSGVARYVIAGESATQPFTTQFHFQCESDGSAWNTTIVNSTEFVLTPPDANCSTELRTDCALCVSPDQLPEAANEQHCVSCASECNGIGLMRCTSQASSDCCTYFGPSEGLCVNGSCPGNSLPNETTFDCSCPPNYTGAECNEDVNECEMSLCENNANCTNNFGGFMCECPVGFTGSLCDVNITDPCEQNPCRNDGSCMNMADETFMCFCPSGYTGATCEEDIDDCGPSNPCMNGATCIDGVNEFTCNCTAGWSGVTCNVCLLERCAICTSNGNQSYAAVCSECQNGYNLENETCIADCLVDGCINCSQLSTICSECENGLTIAQGGGSCSPGTTTSASTGTTQPVSTTSSQVNTRRLTGIVVGSVVGGLVLILLAAVVGAIVYRRKKSRVTVTFDMNTIKSTHITMNPVFDDIRREDSGIENDDEIMVNRGALEFDDD